MAILQISQIQVRRGLQQDLPQLAGGEMGWSLDSQRLYIGNGLINEGARSEGLTEILTEYSSLNFTQSTTANIAAINSNIARIDANLGTISTQVTALTPVFYSASLSPSSAGIINIVTANNAVISYTAAQGNYLRTGRISMSYSRPTQTVSYDDEYTETGTTDLRFTMTANTICGILNYTTTTATSLEYRISSF